MYLYVGLAVGMRPALIHYQTNRRNNSSKFVRYLDWRPMFVKYREQICAQDLVAVRWRETVHCVFL